MRDKNVDLEFMLQFVFHLSADKRPPPLQTDNQIATNVIFGFKGPRKT